MTSGIIQKVRFFRGHEVQLVVVVDEHEKVPRDLVERACEESGASEVILKIGPQDHVSPRWNDRLYLSSLALATFPMVVHFDQDCNAYRSDESTFIEDAVRKLDGDLKFICQPSDLTADIHNMNHFASTRFFMCKRETVDIEEWWRCLDTPYLLSKYGVDTSRFPIPCCLEQIIGCINGHKVEYPYDPDRLDTLIFSWSRYHSGVIEKLNSLPFDEVRDIVVNRFGICGPSDCLSQSI